MVERQGLTDFLDEALTALYEASQELQKGISVSSGRPISPATHQALNVINGVSTNLASQQTAFLDELEKKGIQDHDAARALRELIQSHDERQVVSQEPVAASPAPLSKSQLHTIREQVRKELSRRGWQKPPTKKDRARRKTLLYLGSNETITPKIAAVLLFEEYGGDMPKVYEALSDLSREGLIKTKARGVYERTLLGKQFDPVTGKVPSGSRRIRDRRGLLMHLYKTPSAREELDVLCNSREIFLNAAYDGAIELGEDGKYRLTQDGAELLRGFLRYATRVQTVIDYAMTHGEVTVNKIMQLTGQRRDGAIMLSDAMLQGGIIEQSGFTNSQNGRRYVLTAAYRPPSNLVGNTRIDHLLNYIDSRGGSIPRRQLVNVFPDSNPRSRINVVYDAIRKGYITRIDGTLVLTPEGTERTMYSLQHTQAK